MSAVEQMLAESLAARDEELDDVFARMELASDLLRTHFCTPSYVDTKALAVVSEVLAVLAGDDV